MVTTARSKGICPERAMRDFTDRYMLLYSLQALQTHIAYTRLVLTYHVFREGPQPPLHTANVPHAVHLSQLCLRQSTEAKRRRQHSPFDDIIPENWASAGEPLPCSPQSPTGAHLPLLRFCHARDAAVVRSYNDNMMLKTMHA